MELYWSNSVGTLHTVLTLIDYYFSALKIVYVYMSVQFCKEAPSAVNSCIDSRLCVMYSCHSGL